MATEIQKKKSKLYLTTLLNAPYDVRRNKEWMKSVNKAYGYYTRLVDGKSPVSSKTKSKFNKLFEKIQELTLGEGRQTETLNYEKYNYCGSGTDILAHMRNGILPINLLDEGCFFHDLAYLMAGNLGKEEAKKVVRKADEDLVARAVSISQDKNTERSLKDQALKTSTAIRSKMKLENTGIMDALSFIDFHANIKNKKRQIQYAKRLDITYEKSEDYLKNILLSSPNIGRKKAESIINLETEIKDPVELLLKDDMSGDDPLWRLFGISGREAEVSEILSTGKVIMPPKKAEEGAGAGPDISDNDIYNYIRQLGINISQSEFRNIENDKKELIRLFMEDKSGFSTEQQLSIVESFIQEITPPSTAFSEPKGNDDIMNYLRSIRLDIYKEDVLSDEVKMKIKRFMESSAPALSEEEQRELVEEIILNSLTVKEEEEEVGLGGAGEEKKDDEEDETQLIKETPLNIDELRKQRDRVGQEERVDLNADPPMSAMALTDAKPVVGERNMRPTLFREEGDTIKLSRRQEQENRMFYENFTWIDAGFGNGNIQRLPNEIYAGRDVANNRLYDAQVKNQMLKYSGDLFVGNQQYRKKYDISARTRRLVKTPMHSTVQHHQEFIRDSSLPAGAGRKHQMARDNPSWMPEKNVNSRVGHLYYPDVVDGKRL